jgi:hypothetical protein
MAFAMLVIIWSILLCRVPWYAGIDVTPLIHRRGEKDANEKLGEYDHVMTPAVSHDRSRTCCFPDATACRLTATLFHQADVRTQVCTHCASMLKRLQ